MRKQFIADEITKQRGSGGRVRRFVISTSSVDRDNDTISAAGWQLDNFRKNPVVLWAHDYRSLPLGKAVSIHVESGRLVASAEFAEHPMADTVLKLIDGGFLRATSVGFRPVRFERNVKRGGTDFVEQELLEFSVVPVPANPRALIAAGASDADLTLLKGWAQGALDDARDGEVVLEIADAEPTYTFEQIAAAYVALGHTTRRRHSEPYEPLWEVSPAEVRSILRGAVREGLDGVVRDAAVSAVARMRGRVD